MANHIQDKFRDLYNSVPTAHQKLDELSISIIIKLMFHVIPLLRIMIYLHCHIVSKNDVSIAVKKLKSDKSDVEGRVLCNNYIHGMIKHGYAPATFLQSNMVPILKGARANVTDSNMYRSIAISSIMNKI